MVLSVQYEHVDSSLKKNKLEFTCSLSVEQRFDVISASSQKRQVNIRLGAAKNREDVLALATTIVFIWSVPTKVVAVENPKILEEDNKYQPFARWKQHICNTHLNITIFSGLECVSRYCLEKKYIAIISKTFWMKPSSDFLIKLQLQCIHCVLY